MGVGGRTSYNGLYKGAPSKRRTFFELQVCNRVEISQAEKDKRVGKNFF